MRAICSHHIDVRIADQTYTVHVGNGLLNNAGESLQKIAPAKKALVLTDTNVAGLHLPTLRASLENTGYQVVVATIAPGEHSKTFDGLGPVFETFLAAGIDRRTPVVALGGGIIGDMAGFVAASILRGVPLMQIPTSLLAMVDSSVGGKTGVNHRVGKNLIGAFYHPAVVLADVSVLKTLPARELHAGLAECIKHDIIRNSTGFAKLEKSIDAILNLNLDALMTLVAHNVSIKAKVVMADPFEQGERAHLNLGHTFGHAIETTTNYRYLHGEAISLGLAAAANLAVRLNLLNPSEYSRIVQLLQQAQLPITASDLDVDQVIESMSHDKKVRDGRLRFVLPDGIGKAIIRDDVPLAIVRETVAALRG